MQHSKYLFGLLLIIFVVWLTMILCLIIVNYLLESMEFSSVTYIGTLILNAVMLLMAGLVLLGWLYSWNMLVRVYFRRNLNKNALKAKAHDTKKVREK